MAAVKIYGIGKQFGQHVALKGVDLEILDGEFLTLVGPSGCGKTTLLRIIAGLERQSTGNIHIGKRVVDELPPSQRDVAMVFQSYALYPHMTVWQNIALPLIMRRLNFIRRFPLIGKLVPGTRSLLHDIDGEIRAAAATLGLEELLDRKPRQLSGGQRQRVAVGRALVRHPQVFLMDEPLSNLDAALRVQMRAEIVELHRRIGATFIYVTHDQVEAMTMSDRVVVLMEGEIVQVGTPVELYDDPQSVRVATFIGSPKINLLEGIVLNDNTVAIGDYIVAQLTGHAVGTRILVGIRPEKVVIDIDHLDGVRCVVKRREYLGSELHLHLDPEGDGETLTVRASFDQARQIQDGEIVSVKPTEGTALFFDQSGRRIKQARDSMHSGTHEGH
jgi:multiple sugar transport system ATP-binding protein